jgi:triosephosphate isomerase
MRKNIVVGNWKMNLKREESLELVSAVLSKLPEDKNTEVVFAPSFLYLHKIAKMCNDFDSVFLAAQNCSKEEKGAFTGEVSAEMISSSKGDYVLIGHSERREFFKETNGDLAQKVNRALANNLKVIFCCGEILEQREKGVHFDWIKQQLLEGIFHLDSTDFENIIIAYEPIWAIGTGETANSAQAQEMHGFIRTIISEKYGSEIAENISILYGGSCNSSNAKELFSQKDIDGGLIGGASLKADDFLAIINSF